MEQDEKDFLMSILQDVSETKSLTNVLKTCVYNSKDELNSRDIENSLEILYTKISNIEISLDKFID